MPQEAIRFDVAISGASFAGLALACALSDALGPSFKIALIDRVASASDAPRRARLRAVGGLQAPARGDRRVGGDRR